MTATITPITSRLSDTQLRARVQALRCAPVRNGFVGLAFLEAITAIRNPNAEERKVLEKMASYG